MGTPSIHTIPDSDQVFNELENDRSKRRLSEIVTSAKVIFEASLKHPGYIDRVDTESGIRQTGTFKNGEFRALE